MKVADIIKLNQREHVNNEKNLLEKIEHPFIVNGTFLYYSFEILDDFHLQMRILNSLRRAGMELPRYSKADELFECV